MTNQIFKEPRKGIVAHTVASRLLAEDQDLRDYIGMRAEEAFPAAAKVDDEHSGPQNCLLTTPQIVDALSRYGHPQTPAQCVRRSLPFIIALLTSPIPCRGSAWLME